MYFSPHSLEGCADISMSNSHNINDTSVQWRFPNLQEISKIKFRCVLDQIQTTFYFNQIITENYSIMIGFCPKRKTSKYNLPVY